MREQKIRSVLSPMKSVSHRKHKKMSSSSWRKLKTMSSIFQMETVSCKVHTNSAMDQKKGVFLFLMDHKNSTIFPGETITRWMRSLWALGEPVLLRLHRDDLYTYRVLPRMSLVVVWTVKDPRHWRLLYNVYQPMTYQLNISRMLCSIIS